MYFLYRMLTAAGMFVLAPYYALRGWRRGEPASALRERLGRLPPEIAARAAVSQFAEKVTGVSSGVKTPEEKAGFESELKLRPPKKQTSSANRSSATGPSSGGAIWIHAVSVGEVLAAKPLLDGLKERFPEHAVYVSTTTE